MQRTLDETQRRRDKQTAHNEAHGITPTSISRSVADIMEAGQAPGAKKTNGRGNERKVTDPAVQYDPTGMGPDELAKTVNKLEDAMFEAAHNLEFEQAGKLRDQLHVLREKQLEIG